MEIRLIYLSKEIEVPWLQLHLLVFIKILQGVTISETKELSFPEGPICESHFNFCVEQESPEIILVSIFSEEEVDSYLIYFNPLRPLLILVIILIATV
jgi:hypothetical protein